MKTSPAGLALIEQFEGERLKAYQDGNGVWTIGYGHTQGVHCGQYESLVDAQLALCVDISEAEDAVNGLVHVPLSKNQFDALVSFTYNEGYKRFQQSTMLKVLNAGSYVLAAAEFPKWDIIDGKPSEGLLRRRDAEQTMFCQV